MTTLLWRAIVSTAALATCAVSVMADFPYEIFPFAEPSSSPFSEFDGPGESADYARKVVVSQSGAVFVMGQSIEVGVQSRAFIQCFESNGLPRWERVVELNGFFARELLVDTSENVYAIGRTKGRAGLNESFDVVILKYSRDGVPASNNPLELDYTEPLVNPTFSENEPTAATFAPNGKLYISGYISDEQFAEPTAMSHPFLFAVDPAGEMELDWTSTIHEATDLTPIAMETPVSIAVNSASEVYEVSNYGGLNDWGVTLRKVSASGENVWNDSAQIETFAERQHRAKHVGVDSQGNPYVLGHVEQDGDQLIFAARFNSTNGAVIWSKTYRFAEFNQVNDARVLPDGSTIAVGTVNDGQSWLVFKLDREGELQWQQLFNYGAAYTLAVDTAEDIYIVGHHYSFEEDVVIVKGSGTGQLLWTKTLPNVSLLPNRGTHPPTVAIGNNGTAWVTTHRNLTNSAPDEFGMTYPIYDAVVVKAEPPEIIPPRVTFKAPLGGTEIAAGSSFPRISVDASSPYGIQKVVLYDGHYRIRAVLTNAPYEVTFTGIADPNLSELYAVVYDTVGTAGLANLRTQVRSATDAIQLSSASYRVSESESEVRIVATRTRIDQQASVKLTMTPGSAGPGDYKIDEAQEPMTLYFAEGETTADTVIAIVKDTAIESDEVFTVTLSNPSLGSLGAVASATVTIVDNDGATTNLYGTIEFSEFNYHVVEGVGFVDVIVTRSAGADGVAAVSFYTQPDTTRAAWDYLDTSGTIQFAAGEMVKTIRMYVVNDVVAEATESFYVTLVHPENGASLGSTWFTLVRIQDDESTTGTTTIGFDAASVSVNESAGTAVVSVRRAGNISTVASIAYATSNGTAVAASDYTTVSGQITFNPQETVKTIIIPIADDSSPENEERFFIDLSAPTNATLGQTKKVAVFIGDDDSGITDESFEGWAASVFTAEERGNSEISGNTADPDGDGYPNIVEFALGLDPKSDSPRDLLKPSISTANGIVTLQLSFTRPKGRAGIDYIFKSIDTLGGEACTLCPDVIVNDNGDGTEDVQVGISTANLVTTFLVFQLGLL